MNEAKRPSLREAARRGAEANGTAKPPAPMPKLTPTPAQPVETVQATCGHEVAVGPCKPALLADRLKKLAGQPCADCKRKAQQERKAAEQEAARRRRDERAAREPRPKPRPHIARLPHGATFHCVYDAETLRWSGTLTIPAPGSVIFKESVVSADDGAVFALLQRLDRKYRGVEDEEEAASVAGARAGQLLT